MEKSPFIKKSPQIKSYQFETLFSRTFLWLQYDFMQSPRKKSPLTSENAWFPILGFSFPRIYFLQDFFIGILFPETLLPMGSPHTILGKKSPRNPKHRTLFPVTYFPKFIFPGFFPETFVPGTFFHRFITTLALDRDPWKLYLMFLSRETDKKLCQVIRKENRIYIRVEFKKSLSAWKGKCSQILRRTSH